MKTHKFLILKEALKKTLNKINHGLDFCYNLSKALKSFLFSKELQWLL